MAWFLYALGALFVWRVLGLLGPVPLPHWLRIVTAAMWPAMIYPLWNMVSWMRRPR